MFLELNSEGTASKVRKRKNNVVFFCFRRATTAEKCTNKCDARAKLLFCSSKPIAFLPFSLKSP